MKSRRATIIVAALAVAVALVARSTPAHAAAIATTTATYRLTSTSALPAADPNASAPQVVAQVTPTDGVVPPTAADGTQLTPLTVLKTSTGFDPSQVIVALKDTVSNAGSPEQLFGLSFGAGGLAAGSTMDFTLSIDKALATPPVLQSQTPGISIALEQAPASSTTPASTATDATTPTVPEPMSILLWSTLAGVALVRTRAVRRRRAS